MEGESGISGSIMDELHSWDIQRDQTERESMVLLEVTSMNVIFGINKEIKWKVKVVLVEVSSMNFILGISKEIKWKVSVVLFEVSLMKFILGISKETKGKVKARCYSKNHR